MDIITEQNAFGTIPETVIDPVVEELVEEPTE
jgi:hypothetical protein